ncbi:MAG: NAD-glutamate dehydrogenase [Zoogloeaceae bacterium]|nr:NAD-glutamate dehydrogenase [Zoogloeaceae bacterium]
MLDALPAGGIDVRVLAAQGVPGSVRLYVSGKRIPLSDSLPVMERFALKVADYHSAARPRPDGVEAWTHTFTLAEARPVAGDEDAAARVVRLEEALRRVWRGAAEADAFCALTTVLGLDWREVTVLRAYACYLRQTGFPPTGAEMAAALCRNRGVTLAFVRLFAVMFDPAPQTNRAAATTHQKETARAALEGVDNAGDDRILRKFLMLIEATLRTNHYQRQADGGSKPYLALKFDSRVLEELPLPRPLVEIFVCSPEMEGIHLRGGRIARGGIRWSDRHADFRTEIHGLLKAQMVKNVVIVPEGSKGGFVVKTPPHTGDAGAQRREGIACYETLIRGLLDLTDNIAGKTLVAPREVVCRDGSDPYLVVAADKGTATFSDIANRVAAEYGFWLGDAFASGGSVGYDHKKMGITARGAWESVRGHFREMGRDLETETLTVAGVGDMSGDVFGNGMLLSPGIRLVAAFDHRHVFLDPDAGTKTAFRERQRLFRLPQSSWGDYAPEALGAGGGVFLRTRKEVTISESARQMLGLASVKTSPNAIVAALLKLPVDLLWLGGIGTYVKATAETHEQVGDHANDAVRADARELRCKVVGEGANLGFTQKARIEYALAGGRINTDAIDNAGGVNCSDHEVNIKILLDQAIRNGRLTQEERDRLLADMTDEVAALVLRDNTLQSEALAIALMSAPGMLDTHQRLMRSLEHEGHLDRKVAALPDDEELKARRAIGLGLTRPELAMLLAYTKIAIHMEIIRSRLPDDPLFSQDLARYFPACLRERFAAEIETHPLRREIVATMVTNGMVNRVGSGFVNDLQEKTGCTDAEAICAYAVARDVFELERHWAAIETLEGKTSHATRAALLLEARKLVEAATLWVLRNLPAPLDVSAVVRHFGARVARVAATLPEALGAAGRTEYEERLAAERAAGVPEDLARFYAARRELEAALAIALLAERAGFAEEVASRLWFFTREALEVPLFVAAIAVIPCRNETESQAVLGLSGQLGDAFVRLAESLVRKLAKTGMETDIAVTLDTLLAAKAFLRDRLRALATRLRHGEAPSLALLSVAAHTLAALAEG